MAPGTSFDRREAIPIHKEVAGKMKVYHVLAEALLEQGATTVYALMTSDNMSLLGVLESKGVTIVRARSEYGAVCMADGHARQTGDVGVVAIGAGPSAAMTGTALVTAARRRSPLVVIAGDVAPTERDHLKRFPQHDFFELMAGHCLSQVSPGSVVRDTFEVFRRARSGAGPSVLNIPVNLLEAPIDFRDVERDSRYMTPAVAVAPPEPAAAAVDAAAHILSTARRPIILAGRAAAGAECRDLMMKIGDLVGALYGSSLQGQYLFDSPYDVGVVGTLGHATASRAMTEADCALVVGASLNSYTVAHGQFLASAKIIQVDIRPGAFGDTTPVDVAICSDAATGLNRILAALQDLGAGGRSEFRGDDMVKAIAEDFAQLRHYQPASGALDPRLVLDTVNRCLPRRRRIVVDAGHFAFFVVDHVRSGSPSERVWTGDFASIGLAVPVGLGVATAAGAETRTVVFVGDGGFAMSLVELDTAVRHRIPVAIVVIDDDAYGAEVRYLENRGESAHLARFDSPDFAAIARGYGCEARTVRTLEDLTSACDRIRDASGPLVIDVKVNPDVVNRQFRGRTASAASIE
ncbi:thiamine pyrophosphate-binding protein [Amycolatopsis sp. K13G38]|uniref:Thiamine pyrophosphate-binding protein n=1 Tax=Amycolatopsis acididurans TaxID=2724524 RepID=A0ABX1J8I6_9PSEU|nr:thiamine pyrophosphate-binding protein [Amycolatopsis acididurans]NKQ56106.1 thiamine pyrophosphate-binding protein [Amycolatopsis acididurans]